MRPYLLAPALLAAGGLCVWIYYRREFAVRARAALLAARLAALAGVAAILWNPSIPARSGAEGPDRYAILDASASMAARTPGGGSVWDAAVDRAAGHLQRGARVLVAGPTVFAADADDLGNLAPTGRASALAEAVVVAAEGGAREVVLITDRRIEDPVATQAAARRAGVALSVDTLASGGDNVGMGRLALPSSVAGGEEVRGRVEVEGATSADSVTVTVSVDGQAVHALRLPAPLEGAARAAEFSLGDALQAGAHRVTARVEGSDAFALDDERTALVEVDPEETGVLLVSFEPDWEPRFLLPVLDQVTGLPVRGYLRTGPDAFAAMTMDATGPAIDGQGLERLVRRAEMVVAMGVGAESTAMLERATARTRRLLIVPSDGAGAAMAGVAAGAPRSGEWYVDETPASPIAGDVAGLDAAGLPPLDRLLPVAGGADGAALNIRLGGAGEPVPAVVLRADERRRVAVVLAQGFWRWAFRGGEAREHYRRLWAAVGGWMMADEPVAAGPGVRPAERVQPADAPATWLAPGYEGELVALAVADADGVGEPVLDTTIAVPPGGTFSLPSLDAGSYSYQAWPAPDSGSPPSVAPDSGPPTPQPSGDARVDAGPDGVGRADAPSPADVVAGSFLVDAFNDDMLRLPSAAEALTARAAGRAAEVGGSRPLRTSPLLYLVVLAALCAEWVGRRRAGLR